MDAITMQHSINLAGFYGIISDKECAKLQKQFRKLYETCRVLKNKVAFAKDQGNNWEFKNI